MALVDPSGMASEGSNVGFWDVVGEGTFHFGSSWSSGASELHADWKAGLPEFCNSWPVRFTSYFDVTSWNSGQVLGKVVTTTTGGLGAYFRLHGRLSGTIGGDSAVVAGSRVASRASLLATVLGTVWGPMCRVWG
jgi:hypothetical protein